MKLNVFVANNHEFIHALVRQTDLVESIRSVDNEYDREAAAFATSTAEHASEIFRLVVDKWRQLNRKIYFA